MIITFKFSFGRSVHTGFTLMEVMISMGVLSIILCGVIMNVYRAEQEALIEQDRAIATRAAQQVIEAVAYESLAETKARNGTTFSVNLTTASTSNLGSITVVSAQWNGDSADLATADAVLVTVKVEDTAQEITYAVLQTVRAREE